MEQPNYVLQFKEGSYVPKHESILRNNFLGICYVGRRVHLLLRCTFMCINKHGERYSFSLLHSSVMIAA